MLAPVRTGANTHDHLRDPNQFPDGRPAKSTSIGIKNAEGEYIAALCLNLDVSVLSPLRHTLTNLVATDAAQPGVVEDLRSRTSRELRELIERAAGGSPRSLSREAKRDLVRRLRDEGYFESRDAAQVIADLLGVSRATVYNYAK
ncbi:helix-turn-helix domain-containing protein [Amycolatopsis circi]|uniref:helix-turn-helix domain-containing protein n=1 Tax=Amycolatopsis circi TaxID=871959 RepID=UPI001FCA0632|nr:helix-turn-helix domain-containing protein [Amycolatopsis circi]